MQEKSFKERLASGELVVGSFAYVPSPEYAELIGTAGFDFAVIDMEHGPIGIETAVGMVRALEVTDTIPIIRVAYNLPHLVLQALDVGAHGIHIPNISTVEDARNAVSYSCYSPGGTRGLAGVRAAHYGFREPLSEYVAAADARTVVIAHIEDVTALENLDAMLEIDGIDVYYLGPTDLSNSLGIPGKSSDLRVVSLVEEAIRRIVDRGRIAGCIAGGVEAARRYVELGVRYLACHAAKIMVDGSRAFVREVRP